MMRRVRVIPLALVLATPAWAANEQVMLVLDASGSMWGQIEGRSKVEIARDAVKDLVGDWKADVDLGLVAYGHRRKGDCADIETLLPAAPLNAQAFLTKVNGLAAKGMTPLSQAVIHAADALKASERKATVILISDGEETCNLDPCTVGKELEARGVDFTAHVIGFDVPNPAHQAQLRCLAENTGGRYLNATDAASLQKALGEMAVEATEQALPAAPASLNAPKTLIAASEVEIGFSGPAEERDWIGFAPVGSRDDAYLGWAWVKSGPHSVRVMVPGEPGRYELRYVSARRKPPVLARIQVQVSAAEASVVAPKAAMAGSRVEIRARGPGEARHWIGFAPKGSGPGEYRDWVRPDGSGTSTVTLTAPAVPGEYEVRYVLNEREKVAAAQPITVLPAKARLLDPPRNAKAGAMMSIEWTGPNGHRNWIGSIRKGGSSADYLGYAYTNTPSPARFPAPDAPGDYELVFVLAGESGEQILDRQPLRVE